MGKLLCEKIYGMFGVEMRAYGQKLVKFCTDTQTHRRVSFSSIDTALPPYHIHHGSYRSGRGRTTSSSLSGDSPIKSLMRRKPREIFVVAECMRPR